MERLNPESIGDILREVFRQSCMQSRLDECEASDLWPLIVGDVIAAQCRKPVVTKGVMTVGVADAALRNELAMSRSSLKNAINKALGKQTITEIRFIS